MKKILLALLFSLIGLFGCNQKDIDTINKVVDVAVEIKDIVNEYHNTRTDKDTLISNNSELALLEFKGSSYTVINNDVPFFDELTTDEFEIYSELDSLNRPRVVFANISPETLPTKERGSRKLNKDFRLLVAEYSGRCEPIVPPHRAILPLFRATSN